VRLWWRGALGARLAAVDTSGAVAALFQESNPVEPDFAIARVTTEVEDVLRP
jgi:hypothetical protein